MLALASQHSIRFTERNRAFDVSARIQNTNVTGAKARTALGIIDCLTFLWEHRFKGGCLKNFPALAPTDKLALSACKILSPAVHAMTLNESREGSFPSTTSPSLIRSSPRPSRSQTRVSISLALARTTPQPQAPGVPG